MSHKHRLKPQIQAKEPFRDSNFKKKGFPCNGNTQSLLNLLLDYFYCTQSITKRAGSKVVNYMSS